MISAATAEKSSVSTSASVEASRGSGHTPTDETEAYERSSSLSLDGRRGPYRRLCW